jgi:hypothetical protein
MGAPAVRRGWDNPAASWAAEACYSKSIAGNGRVPQADFAAGVGPAVHTPRTRGSRAPDIPGVYPATGWNAEGDYPADLNVSWCIAFPPA